MWMMLVLGKEIRVPRRGKVKRCPNLTLDDPRACRCDLFPAPSEDE